MADVLPLSVPFDPTPVEDLLRELVLSPDDLVVLALGVSWCYPTELTLRNLTAAATDLKAKHIRIVLVDQERNAAFCAANSINIGVATIHLYFRGRRLQVSRSSQPEVVDNFVGTLDQAQASELLREAFAAITNNAPLTSELMITSSDNLNNYVDQTFFTLT